MKIANIDKLFIIFERLEEFQRNFQEQCAL